MSNHFQKGFAFDAVEHGVFEQAAANRAARALRKLFKGRPVTTEQVAAEMQRDLSAAGRGLAKARQIGLVEQVGARLGWRPTGATLAEETKHERRKRQYRESYFRCKGKKKPKPR